MTYKIKIQQLILFSIDCIANISLYALSRPKLNFGCYLTFEWHSLSFKLENFALYLMQIVRFDTQFPVFGIVLLLNKETFLAAVFLFFRFRQSECNWVVKVISYLSIFVQFSLSLGYVLLPFR
jgi:hypothetical protein